jgi:soluble lytic murein transglycosylase-like protein
MPPTDVPKRGGHKYESMVIQEAQRLGIDPNLAVHVLYKETGNLKDPETARSKAGAIGVMQLMPKTAKGLGVDPLNPEENIRGGVTYLKQMYDKYQDPTLALAAYNAGPGRVDKALKSGQGISSLPRETQNYIVASRMASGGEVQHFEDGGQPRVGRAGQAAGSDFFPESQRTTAAKKKRTPDITSSEIQKLNEIAQGYGVFPEGSSALPGENLFVSPEVAAKTDNVPPAPTAPTITKSTPEEDRYAAFFKKLDQSEANLAKQRTEDKNMALLAAGLGMLGGESPYAFANIGKGGLSGVSYLSDANKQRAAEKAALDKAYVTGLRYQELGDIAKAGKEGTIALRQGELNERVRNNNLLAVKAMRDDARAMAIAGLKQQGLIGMDLDDPNVAAKIDAATKQILSREPAFAEAYKGAYGIDFGKMQSSAMPSNVIKYDKKGKEIK